MATPTPDPPPAPSADPPAGAAPARRGARPSPREVLVRVWAHRRARPEGLRRAGRAAGVVLVVLAGATLGAAMTPAVPASVGPLRLDVRVVPSLDPGVHLLLPPAGRVTFDTDVAPFAVEAAVSEVDPEKARALITSPGALEALQAEAPDALRAATLEAVALSAGCVLAGAVALSVLVYRRRWWRTGQVAGVTAVVLVASAATAGLTFDADRFAQPRFSGLLSQAPYVANQTSSLVKRLESYRSGLADIVQSVTTLYARSGDLPALAGHPQDVVTVLHVSDLHLNPLGLDLADRLVRQFGVDVVVDTGDITTWGTEVESATLSRIGQLTVPYVFVRGNHDSARTQQAVAANPNAVVLDGRVAEVGGLVLAGLGDPRFTPDGTAPSPAPSARAVAPGEDPERVAGRRLAGIVRDWNLAHPDRPVEVAAFHEPAGVPPLDGLVPLVLAGHLHTRSVKELPSGTRLLTEGSTGGAGFDSLRVPPGRTPVPLSATVLYLARSGPRAGQLVAYDEVTVGGFGLASVSLDRTVVRPDPDRPPPGSPRAP